jgi:hypothetical protein
MTERAFIEISFLVYGRTRRRECLNVANFVNRKCTGKMAVLPAWRQYIASGRGNLKPDFAAAHAPDVRRPWGILRRRRRQIGSDSAVRGRRDASQLLRLTFQVSKVVPSC